MIPHSRRFFLHTVGAAVASPALAAVARAQQTPAVPGAGRGALPLKTTGIEHVGISVPDVAKSGLFYGQVFNPNLHREKDPPLRYYATLGVGYIAIGMLRDGLPRVDHFCTLVQDYRPQDVRASVEAAGLPPPGRVGMLPDPDGLQLQLLGTPGGLAQSTVPADRLSQGDALVRPMGLSNVVLLVSDVDKAVAHYRRLFAVEPTRTRNPDRVWLQIANTRLGLQQVGAAQSPQVGSFGVSVAPFDARVVSSRLAALGATVETSGPSAIRFRDPDGIVIELGARP